MTLHYEPPKGWTFPTLEQLALPVKGAIRIGPFGSALKKDEYSDEGVRVLGIEDVFPNELVSERRKYIPQKKYLELSQYTVSAGDILVTNMGTVGRTCVVPHGLEKSIISSHLIKLTLDQSCAFPSYISWMLNYCPLVISQIKAKCHGAIMAGFNSGLLKELRIPLPHLAEQRRIAAILDQADALRAKRRETLAQLDELQRAIFMEMFGDPVTFPKGCVSSTLGDCVEEMQYGPRFYNEAYSEEGVRIVRITDLNTAGSLDFDAMPRMDVDAETQTKFALSAGDIVFARTGATVGKVALMREGDPPCIAGAYFIRMRFQKHILPEYAYSVLQSSSVQSLIAGQSRQAAQQNFSGPGLRRLPMPIPALERQTQFAQRLEAIRNEKIKHLNGLGLVNDLFSSLQHRAFRGEL